MARFSANKDGYRVATVRLDGESVSYVIDCDDEEGWIERAVTTSDGHFTLDGDCVKTEIVHGKVEVELRNDG